MRLCDNEIDRDWERFSPETLKGLAPLFVGKSGIFDHPVVGPGGRRPGSIRPSSSGSPAG